MKSYREFQFSWLIFSIVIPIYLWVTYLFVSKTGDRPMPPEIFLTVTGLFVSVLLFFYGMTTTIDNENILLSFGIGLFRKKISLNRIKNVVSVQTPWYYGYGIRIIPNGWLYNVSGPHAVELRFRDKARIVRIGTKDPLNVKKEIDARLQHA